MIKLKNLHKTNTSKLKRLIKEEINIQLKNKRK